MSTSGFFFSSNGIPNYFSVILFLTSVTKHLRRVKYSYSQCDFISGLEMIHLLKRQTCVESEIISVEVP